MLSLDARIVAKVYWKTNPNIELSFKTPMRIHPRFMAALLDLISIRLIKVSDGTPGLVFTATPFMKGYDPRVTKAMVQESDLSITVD